MDPVLVLPGQLQTEMEGLASRAYPRECCGLLLGRCQVDGRHVLGQRPGRNEAGDHGCYVLAPEDYLATEMAAKASGLAIIGVWHSHPDHPARPSAADQAYAWPGWSYLILSVSAGNRGELRSWRLADGGFAEEEIRHA